eukprot:NODE_442_length_7350_cov_0.498552.p7 type:complete len:220 gc:universal NODE_442_length_7350_cov_0.498552:5839-6498(+)
MKIYESKENEDCRIIIDKGKDAMLVLNEPLVLAGDVKFELTAKAIKKGKFATFWLNTTFIPEDGILGLTKGEIDKLCKDSSHKEVPDKFWIEVRYHSHVEKNALPIVNTSAVLRQQIRPISVLGLGSPLSSNEDVVSQKSINVRRSSASDVQVANIRTNLEKELSRSKTSVHVSNSKILEETEESIRRSGSLPDIRKSSTVGDNHEDDDEETDEETDDE